MKLWIGSLIFVCANFFETGYAFSHKMKCRVNSLAGELKVIGTHQGQSAKIRVGDIAQFDTSKEEMYLHPGNFHIKFINYKDEVAQLYSCTTIYKTIDTDEVTHYKDNGSEGFSLMLQRVAQSDKYIGYIKPTEDEGMIQLECITND